MPVNSRNGGDPRDSPIRFAAGRPIIEGLTTVTFAEKGGKTTMTLHTRGRAVVDYAVGYLKGMEAGWTGSIDKLETLLTPGG